MSLFSCMFRPSLPEDVEILTKTSVYKSILGLAKTYSSTDENIVVKNDGFHLKDNCISSLNSFNMFRIICQIANTTRKEFYNNFWLKIPNSSQDQILKFIKSKSGVDYRKCALVLICLEIHFLNLSKKFEGFEINMYGPNTITVTDNHTKCNIRVTLKPIKQSYLFF